MAAARGRMWTHPLGASSPTLTASAPVYESDEEMESCVICQEERRYLKAIPCGHACCESCLQQLVNQHNDQGFPCPLCRAVTPVPKGGASGFPIKVVGKVKGVIDSDVAAAARLTASGRDSGLCEDCGVDMSRYSCIECKETVCEWCQTKHEGEEHTLVVIRHTRQFDSESVALSKESCQKHGGREYSNYCLTCKTPTCQLCEQLTHSRHEIEDLEVASVRAKKKLGDILRNVEQAKRHLEVVLEDTERCRQMTRVEKQKSAQDIRAKADQIRAMVQQHETVALAELETMSARIDKHYADDISSVQSKLAGLSAIERHLNKVVTSESHAEIVRTKLSATQTLGQSRYLRKFTSDLPAHMIHINAKQQAYGRFADLIRKVIGSAHVKQESRVVPLVKIISELTCHTDPTARITSICSAGEDKVWVVSKHNLRRAMTLSLLDVKTGHVLKQDRAGGMDSIVSVDQGQGFAGVRSSGALLRVNAERMAVEFPQRFQKLILAKGALKAYMMCKADAYIHTIANLDQLLRLEGVNGFRVACNAIPQAMDCSSDGQIFAVADGNLRLHLYRRGATNPYSTWPSSTTSTSHKITDVCFYHISGREFLLVADETSDDVLVLDVQRGCRLVRHLTERSGCLANPTALNVDPYTGKLLVARAGGKVAVCGDTGVKAESGLKHALASLEIVR